MATNTTTIKNGACWYGLHFGCLNTTNDPSCTKCAERLVNAVNYVAHGAATLNDEHTTMEQTTENATQ